MNNNAMVTSGGSGSLRVSTGESQIQTSAMPVTGITSSVQRPFSMASTFSRSASAGLVGNFAGQTLSQAQTARPASIAGTQISWRQNRSLKKIRDRFENMNVQLDFTQRQPATATEERIRSLAQRSDIPCPSQKRISLRRTSSSSPARPLRIGDVARFSEKRIDSILEVVELIRLDKNSNNYRYYRTKLEKLTLEISASVTIIRLPERLAESIRLLYMPGSGLDRNAFDQLPLDHVIKHLLPPLDNLPQPLNITKRKTTEKDETVATKTARTEPIASTSAGNPLPLTKLRHESKRQHVLRLKQIPHLKQHLICTLANITEDDLHYKPEYQPLTDEGREAGNRTPQGNKTGLERAMNNNAMVTSGGSGSLRVSTGESQIQTSAMPVTGITSSVQRPFSMASTFSRSASAGLVGNFAGQTLSQAQTARPASIAGTQISWRQNRSLKKIRDRFENMNVQLDFTQRQPATATEERIRSLAQRSDIPCPSQKRISLRRTSSSSPARPLRIGDVARFSEKRIDSILEVVELIRLDKNSNNYRYYRTKLEKLTLEISASVTIIRLPERLAESIRLLYMPGSGLDRNAFDQLPLDHVIKHLLPPLDNLPQPLNITKRKTTEKDETVATKTARTEPIASTSAGNPLPLTKLRHESKRQHVLRLKQIPHLKQHLICTLANITEDDLHYKPEYQPLTDEGREAGNRTPQGNKTGLEYAKFLRDEYPWMCEADVCVLSRVSIDTLRRNNIFNNVLQETKNKMLLCPQAKDEPILDYLQRLKEEQKVSRSQLAAVGNIPEYELRKMDAFKNLSESGKLALQTMTRRQDEEGEGKNMKFAIRVFKEFKPPKGMNNLTTIDLSVISGVNTNTIQHRWEFIKLSDNAKYAIAALPWIDKKTNTKNYKTKVAWGAALQRSFPHLTFRDFCRILQINDTKLRDYPEFIKPTKNALEARAAMPTKLEGEKPIDWVIRLLKTFPHLNFKELSWITRELVSKIRGNERVRALQAQQKAGTLPLATAASSTAAAQLNLATLPPDNAVANPEQVLANLPPDNAAAHQQQVQAGMTPDNTVANPEQVQAAMTPHGSLAATPSPFSIRSHLSSPPFSISSLQSPRQPLADSVSPFSIESSLPSPEVDPHTITTERPITWLPSEPEIQQMAHLLLGLRGSFNNVLSDLALSILHTSGLLPDNVVLRVQGEVEPQEFRRGQRHSDEKVINLLLTHEKSSPHAPEGSERVPHYSVLTPQGNRVEIIKDGDCLYNSICAGLQMHGISGFSAAQLRRHVADHFIETSVEWLEKVDHATLQLEFQQAMEIANLVPGSSRQ